MHNMHVTDKEKEFEKERKQLESEATEKQRLLEQQLKEMQDKVMRTAHVADMPCDVMRMSCPS